MFNLVFPYFVRIIILNLYTGEYSCLLMELTLKREFSYYMLTIYVPTCMLVIVSWFSFWIDPKAVPARVALGVTTLLTMSTKTASISNSLPPVAYTKVFGSVKVVAFIFIFVQLGPSLSPRLGQKRNSKMPFDHHHYNLWNLWV